MDPTQIQMVLSEVLANASEAISEKGNIRIRLRRVFVEGEDTEGPDALSPGAYACLAVADNGRGMDEETKNRIFEPFFSTKFQGRGLGMAAAYGIVKNHNGSISVDSRAGAGTTVSIFLPVAEPGPDTKSAPGQQNALVQESGTVLVIEDEPQVREICRKILERLGFRVLEAPTAAEAIRIAQSFEGDIDLVLLDYVMPRMQGNDLYQRLKQCRRNVKVIVTSGYPIDGPVQQVLNAGAQGFIQKPFSRNELSEKVFRILGKKRDVP
jgi:CheY-like chemotaxis protein